MNKEKSFRRPSQVQSPDNVSAKSSDLMKTFLSLLFVIKINCFQDYKRCLNVCEFANFAFMLFNEISRPLSSQNCLP